MKNKLLRIILLLSTLFCGLIVIFAASSVLSDEDYLIYLKQRQHLNNAKYTIKKVQVGSLEEGGTTPATDGSGLNLMLIDELQESYAKDVLTCLRNSEEGKYDDYDIKLTVEASCGLSSAETGTYPGTELIKSYLPFVNNTIVWNTPYGTATASEMTLEKFDYTVAAKAGYYTGFGGSLTPFQYDTWSGRGVKASIDGAGNASREKGDHYYYPDILATNNSYITGFVQNWLCLTDVEQDDLSNSWLSFMYAMAHNRGEGGALNYMYGCKYSSGTRFKSVDSDDAIQLLDISNSTVSLYTDYRAAYPNAYEIANYDLTGGGVTIPAAILAVWNDEWFISATMANHLKNNINTSLNFWNVLFPDEQITAEELSSKIDASVATYSEAIELTTGKKVTSSECITVYGADDADALDVWGYSYNGILFKVTNIQSTAYKNTYADGTTPYVIHAMDVICAREAISACFGDIIYARMLAYAGLANVDPTNPDTYYVDPTSLVPTGDMAWMKAYGIDTTKLTVNRRNLLQTGYNIVQLKDCTYCHWTNTEEFNAMDSEYRNNLTPTELECAGFVCRVFRDTGFSGFSSRMACGGLIDNDGNIWECIKPEQLQPGDILVYISADGASGHTMIYLSGDANSGGLVMCTVMESNVFINTQFNRDGPIIRTTGGSHSFATDTNPTRDGTYYCLRLKEMNTAETVITTYK